MAAGACGPTFYSTITPGSSIATIPVDATYELLGRVTGEACETIVNLKLSGTKSADVYRLAEAELYERAKLVALGTKPEADGLIYVRAHMDPKSGDAGTLCAALSGHAFKVTSLKSATAEQLRAIAFTKTAAPPAPPKKPDPPLLPKGLKNLGEDGPPPF